MAVLFLVNYDNDYHNIKKSFNKLSVLTQCINKRNLKRFNLSVASNVMKQLNQKTGGEHIRIQLPEPVIKSPTMIIGIDVCHAGKNSIVGVAASTNKYCTEYFSDFIIQPKFQELVKENLGPFMTKALTQFKENVGALPEKIIIYRDGVGDQMRTMIEQKEVAQIREVCESCYNSMTPPKITLVFVNKRINQRMFVNSSR